MHTYKALPAQSFPGQRTDGTFGPVYRITFIVDELGVRDSIEVDNLDVKIIDEKIKAKIAQHEALLALGNS